jgi:hypothetical protein
MTGPPGLTPAPDTVSPGSREKKPGAFNSSRRVPVLGENDVLVDVCTPDRLRGYLAAPNVEVKRRADGSIKFVRLRSVGNDLGRDLNVQHKEASATWHNVTGGSNRY